MGREAKNPVKTTQRSLDIIETLREMDGARLTELADRLELPNSTVHNHLSTLMERDYVLKDGDVYRVSLRFLDLGEYARNRRKVYELAKPEIGELADETGEVANLLVEENGWASTSGRRRERTPSPSTSLRASTFTSTRPHSASASSRTSRTSGSKKSSSTVDSPPRRTKLSPTRTR